MLIDRKSAPSIATRTTLDLPNVEIFTMGNGVKVASLNQGSQDILKIEVFHKAGRSAEKSKLISRATATLLKEGTLKHSSAYIADHIDYYGSSIKTASNMDFAYISLHTMSKHFDHMAPILADIIYEPRFDQDEIDKYKKINIEKLREELTKNDVVSYRMLTEEIFGHDHPYGYNSEIDDYQFIQREQIVEHWDNLYGSDNCTIFLSGKINDKVLSALETSLGHVGKKSNAPTYTECHRDPQHNIVTKHSRNEHQSSILIGRRLFDKHHPDNAKMFLVNTLLGGYFGSRLMTNIREDKGYTYDIHSSIDQMLFDGYFSISSEAAPEYIGPMIKDIYHEISLLQHEKIKDQELSMVKNYLMGNFINLLDGPLNAISFIKTMLLTDQKLSEFQVFVDELNSLTSADINETAQTYLQREHMIHAIVTPDEKVSDHKKNNP